MGRFYGHGILALVMLIAVAALVAAQPPGGGQGMRGQGMGQGMRGPGMEPGGGPMAALKLTAEQQEQVRAIMQAERDANQATVKQVRDLRKQLHQVVFGGGGDEASALGLANEIAALEAKVRVHMQFAVAALLTPEQRKIVIEQGIEFPPAQMGPGGMRGGRGGPGTVKK
jgi:Spy/CpxP family protein refolding chaperone